MDTDTDSPFSDCKSNLPLGPWRQNVEEFLRLRRLLEQPESMDAAVKIQLLEQAEILRQDIVASMRGNRNLTQMLAETIEGVPSERSRGKSADALLMPESGASSSHQNPSEASCGPAGPLMTGEANTAIPELEADSTMAVQGGATVAVPATSEVGFRQDLAVGGEHGEAQRPPRGAQRPWARGDTTLLVRNIPWDVSQDELIEQWPIDGSYNFFFLPYSDFLGRHLGTAIINFVSPEHAARFTAKWAEQRLSRHGYRRALCITMAETQGRDENLKRVKEDASVLPMVWVGGKLFERHGILQLVRLAKDEAFGH